MAKNKINTLSVFFPAYNEEKNITNTVASAIKIITKLNLKDFEIIVVDDGSTDDTAAIVRQLEKKYPKVRLVRHPKNRGYGGALKTGFQSAKFDWIAFTDSDGQFDFSEINKFINHAQTHDVIVGYRQKRTDRKFRRLMARLLRIWDTLLFGLNLIDVDCGFKLINKSVIQKVFPLVTESAITETELMARIKRSGYPIKQIGVTHNSRIKGEQTGGKLSVIFKAGLESIKLFFALNRSVLPVLSILVLAAFLRLYRIRDYITFLGDEGRDALVWLNIIQKGNFTFLGPTASVGGFYLGPAYYYFALPFYWIWNNPVGPAIFVAVVGILTVWLVWRTTKEWFGGFAGITAASLYAVATLIIRYSRASWNPNPVPFFSLLGVHLLSIHGQDKYSKLRQLSAGICLGILWQLHYLTFILAPVFALIIAYKVFFSPQKNISKSRLKLLTTNYGLLITGSIIGFSPFLAFEIYHHFPNLKSVLEFTTRPGGAVLNFEFVGLLRSITRNINRLFFTVLSWPDGLQVKVVSTIISVLGIFSIIKYRRFSLLIWFLAGITIFSLYQGSIADYYFGFLFPVPFILTGAAAQLIGNKSISVKIFFILLIMLFILDQSGRWQISHEPNRLLKQTEQISSQVIKIAGTRPYNFALITDGNSDHAYRYFLELNHIAPVPLEEKVTEQLIVICEKQFNHCQPLGNPIWEIAGFGRAEIAETVIIPPGITVYRLVHHPESFDLIGHPVPK